MKKLLVAVLVCLVGCGGAVPGDGGAGDAGTADAGGNGADASTTCAPASTRDCYNGPANTAGVGVCLRGKQTCDVNGEWGSECVGEVVPSNELCDGLDNDCDGTPDNGEPEAGAACSTGLPGVCDPGLTKCSGGQLSCTQTEFPSAETCDGLDNDCNGVIDDSESLEGQSCTTGLVGVCKAGKTTCVAGNLSCTPITAPSAEVCDALDNDCDDLIDEGNPGGGMSCGTGLGGACEAGTMSCQGANGVVCVPDMAGC